jgi:hypothetical protein
VRLAWRITQADAKASDVAEASEADRTRRIHAYRITVFRFVRYKFCRATMVR